VWVVKKVKINGKINPIILVSVFFVFVIAIAFIAYYYVGIGGKSSKYFSKYNNVIDNNLNSLLTQQLDVDYNIKDNSDYGNYTIDNPYILVNPYGISPLTALVIFNTDNDTSVGVSINGEYKTTVESSKKHIIPVYGLFANSSNIVTVALEDGRYKDIEIKTSTYNNSTGGFSVSDYVTSPYEYFMLGNLDNKDSYLRGFDNNNNLLYFLNFDYLSKISVYKNRFAVGYNSVYSKNTKLNDLRLEMDLFGRIYSISDNTNDLKSSANLSNNDNIDYYGYSASLYNDSTSNYAFSDVVDNVSYTNKTELNENQIGSDLIKADVYNNPFTIALNGEYITFDFKDYVKEANLIVASDAGNIYSYNINNSNIIKSDIKGKKSLYLLVNGKYYTLLTTLKD